MASKTPAVPVEAPPPVAPTPDSAVVQNAAMQEYQDQLSKGASNYSNRMGNTGSPNQIPNYGPAFVTRGAGSSIITGKA
jgi:hypothetical protein